jgi:N-methylhydantoinase B/oxoprolinase/acetone carboxylase alpha subunit
MDSPRRGNPTWLDLRPGDRLRFEAPGGGGHGEAGGRLPPASRAQVS